jgi:hypothetical protein
MKGVRKRKPGRPTLAAERRQTEIIKFRANREFREKMEAAAAASGRTLTDEIKTRLEQSFQKDNTRKQVESTSRRVVSELVRELEKQLTSEKVHQIIVGLLDQDEREQPERDRDYQEWLKQRDERLRQFDEWLAERWPELDPNERRERFKQEKQRDREERRKQRDGQKD